MEAKSHMPANLIYYKPHLLTLDRNEPRERLFLDLFDVIKSIPFVDRTGFADFPIRLKPLFPMPTLREERRDFEAIANARAREILDRAVALDVDIYVMWSGGIDSTLVICSLLKLASPAEVKRIVVLLSEDSIAEAPEFYAKHICGRLRMESAQLFPYLLASPHLFVTGEHADQLFGSDLVGRMMTKLGKGVIHQPYSRDAMTALFVEEPELAEPTSACLDLFEFLASKAPIPIETNFLFLWWLNFNIKWQSVYLRTLSYIAVRNRPNLTAEYVAERYLPFFCTEPFQQWSLNNPDKRIRDSWNSYKWVAKDIIFSFTGDEGYRRHKVKRGSLFFIILRKSSVNFMDDAFNLFHTVDTAYYRR